MNELCRDSEGDDQFSKEISFVRTVLMMRFDIKESIFEFSS